MGTELLVVVPLYLLMALVFTFPLVLNMGDCVIGDLEGDMWKHLWGLWWVRHCLLDLNVLPLHTDQLNYPYGGALFFIDPLNGLLSTPLQLLWEPTVVYNLVVLFNVVLAAVGAWCLARHLSGNPFAAFFAGTVYGFSAYLSAYITSGVTEAINIGWIPFFTLFFIRMLRTNRVADAARAGAAFAVATFGCWYYGAFCVLFATFFYFFFAARLYRRPMRLLLARSGGALRPPWSRPLTTGFIVALLALLVLACLPKLVDPFQGSAFDFALVVTVLGLGVAMLVRLQGRPSARTRATLRGLRPVALLLAVLAAEAWVVGRIAFQPAGVLNIALVGLQAAVVGSCAAVGLWRRRRTFRILGRFLRPHRSFLLSLGLLALSSLAVWAALRFGGDASGGRIIAGALVSAGAASLLVLRHARLPLESQAPLAGYRRFFGAHAEGLVAFALLSVPVLRALLPQVTALPFLMTWAAVQAFLQFSLAGYGVLRQAASVSLQSEGGHRFREVAGGFWQRLVHRPLIMVLVAAVLLVVPVTEFKRTLNRSDSLVFRKRGGDVEIYLSQSFRNVSSLAGYLVPGKANPTRSYTVDKLTRVSYAGWVALGVVLVGMFRIRRRLLWFWVAMGLLFGMFSLGPFLYVTERIYTEIPSPIYMAFHRWFPLFSQLSIPYRFVTMVMLSLGVLGAFALADRMRGRGRVEQGLLAAVLSTAVLFDVAMFSPAPYPIPLASAEAPSYCDRLASEPGDFGLLDLPHQRFKGELLPGEYFYYQMLHHKAIPNRVEGTIPLFAFQNAFTRYLFVLERGRATAPEGGRASLEQGLEDLSRFRFRYLAVHDNYLRPSARHRLHALLRYYLGAPERHPQNVFLYKVPPQLRFVGGEARQQEHTPLQAKEASVP